jgi:NADPH-dependent curcumin reductase CurA
MKQNNKGRRQELTQLKYKNRLRYWANIWRNSTHITQDGTEIFSPTVQDLIDDNAFSHLKTQAMMCSCGICSYLKYERKDFKLESYKLIKEGLENYFIQD